MLSARSKTLKPPKENSVAQTIGGLKRKNTNRSSRSKRSPRSKQKVDYASMLAQKILPAKAEADFDSVDSDNYETDSSNSQKSSRRQHHRLHKKNSQMTGFGKKRGTLSSFSNASRKMGGGME